MRATDEIVAALNERRIALAFEPVVEAKTPQGRLLRMPDARAAAPTARIAHANEIIPVAERVGLVRMLDHRVLELVVERAGRRAGSARQRQRLAGLHRRSGLVGGARRACCAPIAARPSG